MVHAPAPLVSVLLPVRNAAATIDEAVASVLAQSFTDLELVAVDDGSTDDTAARLEGWSARDGRVRLFRDPPRGLVPALNRGLAACGGRYVARMDGDDWSHPERFAAQVAHLEAHADVGVVGTWVEGFVTGGAPLGAGMTRYLAWMNELVTPEQIARERFIESPLVHPSIMARRSVLTDVGGYRDEPWPEDYDLWLRLLAAGVRLAKVPRVLFRWRDHASRATRTIARYGADQHRALKLAFLLDGPLTHRPPVVFWGAGLEGKPFLRALRTAGVDVPFVVDVDPRKRGQGAGNVVHGARVIGEAALADALAALPGCLVLVAVGVPTARPDIRASLARHGIVEGERCFFLR